VVVGGSRLSANLLDLAVVAPLPPPQAVLQRCPRGMRGVVRFLNFGPFHAAAH